MYAEIRVTRHHAGITTKTYTHPEWKRLQEIIEKLNERLFEKCAPAVHAVAVGAESDFATSQANETLKYEDKIGVAGFEPTTF